MTLAQTNDGRLVEVTEYGKSMYGGWYANYRIINGDISGTGARTLKELCECLNITRATLTNNVTRWDNI